MEPCWEAQLSPIGPRITQGKLEQRFCRAVGVELAAADLGNRRLTRGLRMQYADLGDLLVMLDISLGGGVQDVFRIGQNLVEIPGRRPPQT